MIATLGEDIPPDIRRAVEGSLHGWQRLHRFREAMACPAIGTAARQIGARPPRSSTSSSDSNETSAQRSTTAPAPGTP